MASMASSHQNPTPQRVGTSSQRGLQSPIGSQTERRRGFMGSTIRRAVNPDLGTSVVRSPNSPSINSSFMDEEHEEVKILWGTNFEESVVRASIHKFIKSFNPSNASSTAAAIPGSSAIMIESAPGSEAYYMNEIRNAAQSDQFYITVDAHHIYEFDRTLYMQMIYYPAEVILAFDTVATEYALQYNPGLILEGSNTSLRIQILNLVQKNRMRDLNPNDINHLITFEGIVIRVSELYPEMKEAFFRCSVCKKVETSYIDNGKIQEPTHCTNCQTQHSYELIHNNCYFQDKQFVKLQETPDTVPEGETPNTVSLLIYDEQVDRIRPGDRIEVVGIYRAQGMRVNPVRRELKSVFKTYVDVVSVTTQHKQRLYASDIEEEDEVRFTKEQVDAFYEFAKKPNYYDLLVESFAPSIWEADDVKKGILCQLFGGTTKDFSSAGRGRFRAEVNILLCGDPSTAKSQLLQFVHKIASRGLYTSGKGSSAVGLTAYVNRDPETKEVVLESGALVLSDRGICCIDEFDKMDENSQTILHEAMEQQTISVAKAGIVCSLNARTAILASANPKESRYNPTRSVIENIMLPPTLLSRFDLIYLMLDKTNESIDKKLAAHILTMYSNLSLAEGALSAPAISRDFLAKYVSFARKNIKPKISPAAEDQLIRSYVDMRRVGNSKNIITATPRQLESLIRLSEAQAKMRLSKEVQPEDVQEALRLIKVATQQAATDPQTGQIDMDLITSGFTAGTKLKINRIVESIQKILSSSKQIEKSEIAKYSGLKGAALADDLRKKIDPTRREDSDPFSDAEYREALRTLEEMGEISWIGYKTSKTYGFTIKYLK